MNFRNAVAAWRLLAVGAVLSFALVGCGGGGGGGGGGTGGTGGTTTAVPSAPWGVKAAGAEGRITISWTPDPSATSHNIYWSTSPGVTPLTGTKIAVSTANYVHTGLSDATTYYYVVTAVNSAGESTPSVSVSATPPYGRVTRLDTQSNGSTIFPQSVSINATGSGLDVWLITTIGVTGATLNASTVKAGAWAAAPTTLSTMAVESSGATTAAGDSFVVFSQTNSNLVSSALYAAKYTQATNTWTTPALIGGNTTTGMANYPNVAVDGNGNAMAVWSDGSQVFAEYYNATTGSWAATPVQISAAAGVIGEVHLVADGTGTFTAVWAQADSTGNTSPFIARYSAGTWSASSSIGFPASATTYGVGRMAVAGNASGNVSVVWEGSQTTAGVTSYSVYNTNYDPSTTTWTAATAIFTPSTVNMYSFPVVAVDGSGNATVGYEQDVIATGTPTIWAARYGVATGWTGNQEIDRANGNSVSNAAVAMDNAGNAEFLWQEVTAGVVERRFNVATGTWTAPNTKAFKGVGQPLMPIMTINAAGWGLVLGSLQDSANLFNYYANAFIITP